jgi:general secretion pathway protein F
MENQLDLNNRIRSALTYPVFMALLGVAVLFFLMTAIVPNIAAVFAEMGRVLPAPTRLLIAVSDFIRSFWWLLLLFCLGGGIFFFKTKRSPRGREVLDRLILRMPFIGFLALRLATARFARTLGSLLQNGVPMLQALDIVQNVVGYTPLSRAVQAGTRDVEKGSALAEALAAHGVFPDLFMQMVKVGEQSGKLEAMLEKTAGIYEKEVAAQVTRITALLEPVMILVMGLIVGGIVLSICLPIFEMNQLVF